MMKKANQKILTFYPPNSEIKLEVLFTKGSVWLTKSQIVDLIQPESDLLNCINKNEIDNKRIQVLKHITEQYDSNYSFSLENTKFFELDNYGWFITTKDRQRYYNVDSVLSLAYEFDFKVAKHFRKWSDQKTRENQVDDSYHPIFNLHLKQLVLTCLVLYIAILINIFFNKNNEVSTSISLLVLLILGMITGYVNITKHDIEKGYRQYN